VRDTRVEYGLLGVVARYVDVRRKPSAGYMLGKITGPDWSDTTTWARWPAPRFQLHREHIERARAKAICFTAAREKEENYGS
jgi:hypothetical protein